MSQFLLNLNLDAERKINVHRVTVNYGSIVLV